VNVVFFGTADFGLPTLEAIRSHPRHRLVGVVTGTDKPRGRGLSLSPTPIAAALEASGFQPVLKPERLNDADLVARLQSLDADAFVVVAFRILPESVYTLPRFAFNLHASLLPAYRGAAPIQRAIMAGETRTGVTTFLLKKTVDTGDIIGQRETQIGSDETGGVLYERLSGLGAELVIETLDQLESGHAESIPQDPRLASPAPKITDADLWLEFGCPAHDLINQVRALAPRPGASARFRDGSVKIFALAPVNSPSLQGPSGAVVALDHQRGPVVATGQGLVSITQIQPAGKKTQSGAEFIRGYHPEPGELFGAPTKA
jgi:methionyl-tRNA formyltransferase